VTFLFLKFLIRCIAFLDLRILYLLADVIAFCFKYIFPYRKKVILQNLYNSFPEKNEQEIEEIAKQFYNYFADLIVETIKMSSISKEELLRRCRFTNPEILHSYYEKNRSIIAVCGHFNNWELGALALSVIDKHQMLGVYKPLSNNSWDEYFKTIRSRFGMIPVPMKSILRELIKRKNEPTITALAADQTPHRSEINYRTTFLNQDTAVFLGAEKLCKQTNYPLIYFSMHQIRRGYYDITIIPISDDPKNTAEHELTHKHLRLLENDIHAQPGNWLWSHRRWKY
jgi:KDO2-lipid IV(A) lauroyltransferase